MPSHFFTKAIPIFCQLITKFTMVEQQLAKFEKLDLQDFRMLATEYIRKLNAVVKAVEFHM